MQDCTFPRIAVLFTSAFLATFFLNGQQATPPAENTGLPPRATPADYQFQAKVGSVTVAAEFAGHSVPTPEGPLSTEDFIVVEVGLFGPQGSKLVLQPSDFSLRINGKKAPVPTTPVGLVLKSLKDPTWEPPETTNAGPKSKGGLTSGNSGGDATAPSLPPIIHVPIELQRSWNKRAQKASLPEGDRALPQAGLLFFEHSGKVKSAELLYEGPAGKAKLTIQ